MLAQALLLGAGLGAAALCAAGLVLFDTTGLLAAATGLMAMLLCALALGMWAGAPGALGEPSPLRARWVAAGLVVGAAGAFATFWGLYGRTVVVGPIGRMLAMLVLVGAPAYVLGLVAPALLAWAERREERAAEADAEEAARGWGVLGVVVIAVLAGVVIGALLAGLVLLPRIGAGPLLFGIGAALLVPTLFPEAVEESDEEVLYEADTPFGVVRVLEVRYPGERQPERRLFVNGEEESGELVRSGAPTLAYIAAAERWLTELSRPGASYLFLGGGAYTLPRRVAERDGRARITVVELDPEVTRVAYRFFGARREHGLQTRNADARAFLEQAGAGAFDRIYVDVYAGHEALPYSLVTAEAFELLAGHLAPGGWLAINAIGVTHGAESRRFWSLVRTIGEVFPTLALYTHLGPDFPERQNVLIAASRDADAAAPASAGVFQRWPQEAWPRATGAIVYHDLLQDAPGASENAALGESRGVRW